MDDKPVDDATLSALLEKFAQADCCWFSSVRPDGRAHLAPIWHVWHQGRAYVVTPSKSVRARNVACNHSVSLSLADPMNVFIIEGFAAPANEMEAALQPLFKAKYDWDISTDADYDLILAVTPAKLMAWGDHGEGRWQWGDGA